MLPLAGKWAATCSTFDWCRFSRQTIAYSRWVQEALLYLLSRSWAGHDSGWEEKEKWQIRWNHHRILRNLIRKVVRNMPHYDPSDTRIILEVFRDYNLHIGTVNYSMTYSSSCVQSNSFTRALRNFHMGLSTIVETTLAGVGGEKRENRSPWQEPKLKFRKKIKIEKSPQRLRIPLSNSQIWFWCILFMWNPLSWWIGWVGGMKSSKI